MFKRLSIILSTFIFAILFSAPATALESGDVVMSLTPANQDLELEPGQQYQGSLTVTNVGRLPFDVKASVSPYYVGSDNYDPDFSAENAYTKLPNWITLEKYKFHLEPSESTTVRFAVDVPEDVAAGGQYAAIMLLSDAGDTGDDNAVKVSAQLAAILYGHVNGGELRTSGELTEHDFPGFVMDGKFSVSQTVKNDGNVDFKVTQKLTIKDFFSNQDIITPDSVSDDGRPLGYNVATVLPGTSRTGILTWENAPQFGLYHVTQEISFLDQTQVFSRLVFFCPVWLIIIVGAVILVLILWLILSIIKKHKRHQPAVID